jgi:hypothetical protein
MTSRDPVKDFVHVGGISHHAIKVGSEVGDIFFEADVTNFNKPLKIPLEIIPAEFNFEALQTIALDPVAQKDGVAIIRFVTSKLGFLDWIETTNKVPNRLGHGRFDKVVGGVFANKFFSWFEEIAQVAVTEPLLVETLEGPNIMKFAEGIIESEIKGGEANEAGKMRHVGIWFAARILFTQAIVKAVLDIAVPNDERMSFAKM